MKLYPERAHLVGAYALGKCQRIICLLREAGYHETIYLHGAVMALCDLYREFGVDLGDTKPVADMDKESLKGKIVMAPPSRASRPLVAPIAGPRDGVRVRLDGRACTRARRSLWSCR